MSTVVAIDRSSPVPLTRQISKWLPDRHTPVHQQATLCQFMKEGLLERHIRRMRRTYDLRRTTLVEALHTHFGDRASVLGEAAGMHA